MCSYLVETFKYLLSCNVFREETCPSNISEKENPWHTQHYLFQLYLIVTCPPIWKRNIIVGIYIFSFSYPFAVLKLKTSFSVIDW